VIADADLRAELERALGERIVRLERRESRYRTSFALEEVDVELPDGRTLALMFKNLGPDGLDPVARATKPAFLLDPLREIEVYRDVLAPAALGTPAFHGASAQRGWLFVERVRGVELNQVGARTTWEHVARWLAGMHERLAGDAERASRALRYDAELYALWPRRAADLAAARGDGPAAEAIGAIADGYKAVIEQLLALPVTVIHGEFYASNVLVDDPEAPRRVAPVDWEQAAIGPGLIDLAALTAGGWSQDSRAVIAEAYRSAATTAVAREPFAAALDACRLHLALQWLGWAAGWTPPADQRQDWLGEAVRLARRLGIAQI
jgi:hypothetical protein